MKEPKRKISEERQIVYYAGMALTAIGFMLFISTFFTGISMMGNSKSSRVQPGSFPNNFQQRFNEQRSQFEQHARQGQSAFGRAVIGMLFMIGGGVMMNVGAKGLAGSGVVLDPQQAREDLEPYSRMTGGMIKDAIDETGIKIGGDSSPPPPETVIKVRCRECDALNDEDAKFCDQCGAEM